MAGRPVHRPDGRGPQVRPREDEGLRLQHDPQAYQGGARPLVLLLRPAGYRGLAGHAVPGRPHGQSLGDVEMGPAGVRQQDDRDGEGYLL